jgi:ribosomal protein S18 acetylase RimI-like enzyme
VNHPVAHFSFPNPDGETLAAIIRIEVASFPEPFTLSQLRHYLTRGGVVLRVYRYPKIDGEIVGYSLHRERLASLYLARLAVDPVHRRRGIGTAMLQPLLTDYRGCVCTTVCETNLGGQLFLKRHRFCGKLMAAAADSGMRDEIAMIYTAPHFPKANPLSPQRVASEAAPESECGR